MKTRVITSAVGLVVLFAVMALFDTFVFNVVIAAICLLAIHEAVSYTHLTLPTN